MEHCDPMGANCGTISNIRPEAPPCRHERLREAVVSLEDVLLRLNRLHGRLSGEDVGEAIRENKPVAASFQSVLEETPDQLHRFREAAICSINELEDRLF